MGGGGSVGLHPPKPPKTEIKKKMFVDIISKILRDFPISRNEPLK